MNGIPQQSFSWNRQPFEVNFHVWTWILCLFLLTACAPITLVSKYDELIDRGITELHKSTAAFLLDMKNKAGTPEGTYENNRGFYVDALSSLASIHLRAVSTAQNDLTAEQLELLRANYDLLAQAHEAQEELGLNEGMYAPIKANMDVQFGAILTFEIAKKRGEE